MHYLAIEGLTPSQEEHPGDWESGLCPRPHKLVLEKNNLKITPKSSAMVSDEKGYYLLDQLNEELEFLGGLSLQIEVSTQFEDNHLEEIWEELGNKNPEGFALAIGENRVVILGNNLSGLFYGLQTLYQMMVKTENGILLPACRVSDYPEMAIRGLSDDISRGQSPRVEVVKRYIKLLSRFRLNMYMFYTEDTFSIQKYPQIGKGRGPLTPAIIKEIQDFAKNYHVEVVPIYQTLGHMENILLDPELRPLGEFPGSACLNLADERIYPFLSDLLGEVAPAFDSPRFHIGCDESWDVGVYGGKKFIEERGMGVALRDHYNWVIQKLKELGKTQMFLYHDIAFKYPEVLEGLPKDGSLVFVYWDYSTRDSYPNIDPIRDAGLPFVVSSSVLSWCKPFPDWREAIASNRALITEGLKKGAIGQINSSWGDNGQENLRENQLLAWAFSSVFSWNPAGVDLDNQNILAAFFQAYLGHYDPRVLHLYDLLAKIWETFPWRLRTRYLGNLWRHPYPRSDLEGEDATDEEDETVEHWEVTPDIYWHEDDVEENREQYEEIIQLTRELKQEVSTPRHPMAWDYFEFAGRHMQYFTNKIQTSARVTHLCRTGLDSKRANECENLINRIIAEIKDLRVIFEKLWLNCANRPMIDRILRFYDWQVWWQEEKLSQIQTIPEVNWVNPYIESEWIWHIEAGKHQESRCFRHSFSLSGEEIGKMRSAFIQVAPGNYARIWVNGNEIGEVQTSFHLSAPVIDHSVEYWDVKKLLQAGKNTIAIEATNFFYGNPVVNCYGELTSQNGEVRKVLSNKMWKTSPSGSPGWREVDYDDGNWVFAGSKGRPPKYFGEISKPRFDQGWKSKITHYGYGRILREKATNKSQEADFFDDFFFFSGNIL